MSSGFNAPVPPPPPPVYPPFAVGAGQPGKDGVTGSAWNHTFVDVSDYYIPAVEAMTVERGNVALGTGTVVIHKSTAADPTTFSSGLSYPVTLEAGAWLKLSCTAVTGFIAVSVIRTA